MAFSHLLHLNPHRIRVVKHLFPNTSLLYCSFSTVSSDLPPPPPQTPKPTSLSARMSFIFDQIDQIENSQRNANEEKDKTLQRIRAWRQSKNQNPIAPVTPIQSDSDSLENLNLELEKSTEDVRISRVVEKDKEVVLVHPWAEWIEFMERLVQQNYFDYRRKDEDGMMERLGVEIAEDGSGGGGGGVKDLMRDFKAVQNAVLNFGRDRFDILRFLSRQDLQLLVGYGCPTTDKRTVFSAKLLRKHVHLDEGDVCSSCSLRNSCEKAYLLTNKEDEARTIDVMRILLTYGFEPIYGSVENKSLLQMKSVKTVIRKLLHEVVKLSAVPIDPNLSPPVIKKPPPKVKQPPPPPRKKIGRNDIEMKKGDWLCPKCDFMNFAKNTVCLHCDAKRPKRQLLPGEWECPQCNFLNYRRNTVCFHCEHNRPPETYAENQFTEKQYGPGFRTSKIPDRASVSNAWNFDFDDNESDGADVAAFENADSLKLDEDYSHDRRSYENSRRHQNSMEMRGTHQRLSEHSDPSHKRPGVGFNDFDEEDEDDVDNYELVNPNEESKISRVDLSELESDSGSEDRERNRSAQSRTRFSAHGKKQQERRALFTGSEDEIDFNSDDDLPIHPKYKSTHVAANMKKHNNGSREGRIPYSDDEDDIGLSSDIDDEIPKSTKKGNFRSGYDGSSRTKGARSSFKAAPFSDMDSDNGRSYNNGNKQRDRSGRHSLRDESREWGSKRSSFDRRSGSRRNNTDNYENSYRGKTNNGKGGKFSKFAKPDRQHASFDKRGGRSSNFDNGSSSSFLDDERHRRPRNNVR